VKAVPLYGRKAAGRVALVDDADYELVMAHRWRVLEKIRLGRVPVGPYARSVVTLDDGRQRTILMHVLITGSRETDHANHDGLDNRRENLRPTTRASNAANARPQIGRSSTYKGVHWHRTRELWRARITVNRRTRQLGEFRDEVEAARAYDAAAREAFGEFACLNFPAA
jgi:hypothetical protein